MFQVTRKGDNRIDIEFSGKLNSDEMKVALHELFSKTEGIEHGRMLYRIRDFDLPTLGAVAVELSFFPKMIGFIRKFDRAAVLAGKDWLKRVSEMEGALIPGLKIKSFDIHEESEAEAWLEG